MTIREHIEFYCAIKSGFSKSRMKKEVDGWVLLYLLIANHLKGVSSRQKSLKQFIALSECRIATYVELPHDFVSGCCMMWTCGMFRMRWCPLSPAVCSGASVWLWPLQATPKLWFWTNLQVEWIQVGGEVSGTSWSNARWVSIHIDVITGPRGCSREKRFFTKMFALCTSELRYHIHFLFNYSLIKSSIMVIDIYILWKHWWLLNGGWF